MLRRRAGEASDEGFSLMELIISMGIFSIVIAVFLAGLVTMTRSTLRAEHVADAGASVRAAFQTMDKQIRYASSINYPGAGSSGSVYVEFKTDAQPDGLAPLCAQWRYDPTARTLAYRTWRDTPSAAKSTWKVIATEVRNPLTGPAVAPPFVLVPAGATSNRQQLQVVVQAGLNAAGEDTGADTSTVFVARNSSLDSPSNKDENNDHKSDAPVCAPLERP